MTDDVEVDIETFVGHAIAEYLATTGGGFVSDYHLVANVIDGEGERRWIYCTAPDQLLMTTMGLLEWARNAARYEQQAHFDEIDEED